MDRQIDTCRYMYRQTIIQIDKTNKDKQTDK